MSLPIDRSTLALAQGNQVPGLVASSAKNINFLKVVADTIDELNVKVDAHASSVLLPHTDASVSTAKLADAAVTAVKIAPLAVTNDKIANATIDATKFVPGVLTNETANGLQIVAIKTDVTQRAINVKYPPSPLAAAFGNGTTVDSVAINAMLAALGALGGGTLVFPKATYIASQLLVPSNVTIDLHKSTIKAPPNIGMYDVVFLLDTVDNVTIKNGIIDGNKANQSAVTEYQHGIKVYDSTNIEVSRVTAQNCKGDGVSLSDGTHLNKNITLRKVKCDGNHRNGLTVSGCDGFLADDCDFINTSGTPPQAGVDIEPNDGLSVLKNIVFQSCRIKNNANHGFYFYTHGTVNMDVTIENCFISGNVGGVYSDNSSNVSLINNVIISNTYGIYVQGDMSGLSIVDNLIEYNISRGIVIVTDNSNKNISNVMIINNDIKNTQFTAASNYGIQISGLARTYKPTHLTIIGNKIFDDQTVPTQKYPMQIDTCSNVFIAMNEYYGNTQNQDAFLFSSNTSINVFEANSMSVSSDFKTSAKLLTTSGLGVGNSVAATTLGTLSKKMQVFDASGASIGYVPVYTTIT